MKRLAKYLGRILLAILLLLLLVISLIYLSPVQRVVIAKATDYLSERYGVAVEVGRFRLGFPASLVLEDVYCGHVPSDTLLALESLRLKVGIGKLFQHRFAVDDFTVKGVRFGMADEVTGMRLRVVADEAALTARRVDWGMRQADAEFVRLKGVDVALETGREVMPDTAVAGALDWIFRVGRIDLQEVAYRMTGAGVSSLVAGIRKGSVGGVAVDLERQSVAVDSLCVSGGNCRLVRAETSGEDTVRRRVVSGLPWTISAGNLQLDNSAFSAGGEWENTAEWALSGIGICLDSVYNRGIVVKARLRDLRAVQPGGVAVTGMRADAGADSTRTWVRGGYVRTLNSWLELDVYADAGLQHLLEQELLSVRLTGQVGMADVQPFYSALPEEVRAEVVNVNTVFSFSDRRLQVGQLVLDMANRFRLTGSGSFSSFRDVANMKGAFVVRGEMSDVSFAQGFVGDTGVRIPRNMELLLRLSAERGSLTGLLRWCAGQGCLSLDAGYDVGKRRYDADLTVNRFPLGDFLPGSALGALSATCRFSGQGFAWEEAECEVSARIGQLSYKRYDYEDVSLDVSLRRTRLKGAFTSRDAGMPVDLVFRGDSAGQAYRLGLSGKAWRVDLQGLHWVDAPLAMGGYVDVRATAGRGEDYALQLRLDSLYLWDARGGHELGSLELDGASGMERTRLEVVAGDLELTFRTDTSVSAFAGGIARTAVLVGEQVKSRNADMELVQADLPPFGLRLSGGQENAVARFLKSRGMGLGRFAADVVSRKRGGIRAGLVADAPYRGDLRLDSVRVGCWQTGKSLVFSLAAGSSSEVWKGLFNVNATGRVRQNRFRMELKQRDAQGEVGFDLGVNTVIGDSSVVFGFFPTNPVLGYSRWEVNADNRVEIGPHGRIRADLNMAYQDRLVRIRSLDNRGDDHERLQVEMAGIDLAGLSRMVPFMPQVDGVLHTSLLLYTRRQEAGVDGGVRIAGLGYGGQRIGTLDLGLKYVAGNRFTDHAVYFELNLDSVRRAVAQGTFSTSGDRNVEIDAELPSVPLSVANAFVSAGLVRLGGELTGNVHFRGTADAPRINGALAFREGTADVVMLGTVFRLDTARIDVRDGRIGFRKYRLFAPDNSPLLLNGYVALTPFDRMNMDVAVEARNFELVNVRKNETSLIYGKAYADIQSRIAGMFSDLSVSGNANLLNRTDITYTLRGAAPEVVDKSADLVRFVSFRDTTLQEKDELTNRVSAGGFALRMLVEIGDQVRLGVDLSDDGNDRVNIQGGGNLVLAMNPESGTTLSGKYILTGGVVVYNVPIVGKKEFSIQNGSFVEWTGNVMNPALGISASSQVKADVEDGDQTRQVVFDAIIRIRNTLNRPDVTFDLSAPNDMVIQNQLSTFSPEERTRQALNLLIYGTYTAPGAAKSNGSANIANNAIYGFVENELNKYTRKAGLTVGFDSRSTEENTMRTDVTYQFSRQLFNDRVRVKIGGRISTDGNEGQGGGSLQDNLVDDISIEYVLTKRKNLYAKVFRHSNYESVLDGEVTQTGAGIVWRKNFRKFRDLFKNKNREERKARAKSEE